MTTNKNVIGLVLAGGNGTRLVPLSTPQKPKQFLNLASEELSLLQQALLRAFNCPEVNALSVITNYNHRHLVDAQCRQLWASYEAVEIILETVPRNTAPAITYAALLNPDAILLILPSDHYIASLPDFQVDAAKAIGAAADGKLVTFGIVPTEAHTGYGYIKRGEAQAERLFAIDSFAEKPDAQIAEQYISEGYLWNSGMFCFRSDVFLAEIKKRAPAVYENCVVALDKASISLNLVSSVPVPDAHAFEQCSSISIDYAVMEKTDKAVVIEASFGWSDLGSWDALNEIRKKLGLESLELMKSL